MTAVVTSTVPSTVDAFMHEHIRQLQDAGHEVVVVTSPGPQIMHIREAFPQVHVVEIRMTRGVNPIGDLISLLAWIRLLRRFRAALIVSKTPKSSLLSMLAGFLTHTPRRIYASGGLRLEGSTGLSRILLTWVERLTCWAASEVVPNSPSLGREYLDRRLVSKRKMRTTISGQGVDSAHFRPGMVEALDIAALGLDPSLPVVGFVGRLTADKGIPTLIEAARGLSADRYQLLVVGAQDEPDSDDLFAELRGLSLSVAFVDAIRDVRPAYEAMDLVVLPSVREGFPNVVLEAGAMSLATVTTDATGCIDSVVDGVTGRIVPVGDAARLKHVIADLIGRPHLRAAMGRAARDRVVRHFAPEQVVADLLRLEMVLP